MPHGVFQVKCPCCDATLEVDVENETILSHQEPVRPGTPTDLLEAVKDLKAKEGTRDERFQKHVESEKRHGAELEKRFKGLLKKTKSEGPVQPSLRDIDLD